VPLPGELSAAIEAALSCPELALPPWEVSDTDKKQPPPDEAAWCSEQFRRDLRKFLRGKAAEYDRVRVALGLPRDVRGRGPGAATLEAAAGCTGLSRAELDVFVARCISKYEAKRVDPGD
jgi:hypothetical protein